MGKAIYLQTNRLVLMPITSKHITQNYVDWLNDPEVSKYLEISSGQTLETLAAYIQEVEQKDIYFWGIHLKDSGKHIGNIKIDPVNTKNQYGEYGILMGDKSEWKKGYAKEASICIIDFCFSVLHLRRITLGVIADNIAAVKLYENLGFEQEGIYRKHGLYDGKYCDCLRMAIFNPSITYPE